ncbi:MAG: PEP-CTERM sorting domain-containing protein [Planctomycetota bacterium]
MKLTKTTLFAVLALLAYALPVSAQILTPGDPIIALDADFSALSSYPGAESPINALDNDVNTKYLNFGKTNTGLIFTPDGGSSTVQSMMLRTANDAVERDPMSWEIYGTNSAIASTDNGDGNSEPWTLISSGMANLPDDRFMDGPLYSFSNSDAYSSYKVVFPDVKDAGAANSMQVADILMWEANDGTGTNVATASSALALAPFGFESSYPAGENPSLVIDGDANTKYLNFGEDNSGFIVTPQGPNASNPVNWMKLTTANDDARRDPSGWKLYGTNDAITSGDNTDGLDENWTMIDSGTFTDDQVPMDRLTEGSLVAVNSGGVAYSSYRMEFTVREANGCCMQLGDIQFMAVPEPSSMFGMILGLGMLLGLIRRR